jgi:hypothetical protein
VESGASASSHRYLRAVEACPTVRDATLKNTFKSFAIGNVGFGRVGRLPPRHATAGALKRRLNDASV